MTAKKNSRSVVSGTKLAPRKKAPASRARTAFVDPDTRENQAWRLEAACLDHDPDLWFSDSDHSQEYATAICFGCPVREKCLAWATDTHQSFGIWGGIDFSQTVKPWHAKRKH